MRKVLIANRGEIAVRVARTVQQMGMAAVAVYAEPDRESLHLEACDEAWPVTSYLDASAVLRVAVERGCSLVHPGYGFLSENARFARRCAEAGLTFIGPPPDVIESMGDKIRAKETMVAAGVPIVPSWNAPESATLDDFRREAARIGYPVLIKAAAGGGGKGMRLVTEEADLEGSLEQARGEAGKAFGDPRVFLERYLANPRHVEIQMFGDSHGQVVHLGERECSIQRRYQKIVEESPCPVMTPELRAEMGAAACRAAAALGYTNAGTCEFLLDADGRFYFLEVNTRLQVEHPVTEEVTGQDLVRAQLLVAQGERLPFAQEELAPSGWAMETRLYAEDPWRGFMPSTGRLAVYEPPPGVRLDSGVRRGSPVTVHYDPMLAKLITSGKTREEARARMDWALSRFIVLGVTHNLEFLRAVINHPAFVKGDTSTHFLQQHVIEAPSPEVPELARLAMALAGAPVATERGGFQGPFEAGGAWRL